MACRHITNFTSAHESHARKFIGNLEYPDQHIEVDGHLSIAMPLLIKRYPSGPDTVYVHLIRERKSCVDSFSRRHGMDLFAAIHCFVECTKHTPERRLETAGYAYDVTNAIIDTTLRKAQQISGWSVQGYVLTTFIEDLVAAWPTFWELIGAEGDYTAALAECAKRYNRGLESKGETVRDEH